MRLSRAAFYHSPHREEKQMRNDMELRTLIEEIHLELPGYGYRRIQAHLLREGKRFNHKRIKRVMKKYALFSCLKKMMKPRGSNTGVRLFYPNLIRGLKINAPNKVWAVDLTYIKLVNEYVYLNAVIDVYTRKIVGWAISRDLSHKFCLQSLDAAVKKYKPPVGIIHHSGLGYKTPSEFEEEILKLKPAKRPVQKLWGRSV
jgi:putative transposase